MIRASEFARISESGLFDTEWYASTYQDVGMLNMDPIEHYIEYGARMGRRPNPNFDAAQYVTEQALESSENPFLHFIDNLDPPIGGDLRLPITDIQRKLWGGASARAGELLRIAVNDGGRRASDRAKAALTLARWHSALRQKKEALFYIQRIQRFDKQLYRSKRVKLLQIDALLGEGGFARAIEMISYALANRENDADYLCALNNLEAARAADDNASRRIALLNRIFISADLCPIELQRPSEGLAFGNIACPLPADKYVDGPMVSVLVPVYRAEAFLHVALTSLLEQSWRNLEIIAVDDCSPDGSWEILQEYAAGDARLKVFRNEKNRGAYSTRNRALELCTGDYITVHDSDDWSHPQMIEQQMTALMGNDSLRATCSAMARITPEATFILRPQRENLEFVHRSYPSLLMKREDLAVFGGWDSVSANADDELVQRVRLLWGREAIGEVLPHVPMSFFLVHENSLTQQKGTSLNSLTFGIRREYARQAAHWRAKKLAEGVSELPLERTSFKAPFPIPQQLAPKDWPRNLDYDIVLISDLSLLGGTRRCNEGYIAAATRMGLRVGLFHWPRFDLRLAEVAEGYLDLSYQENVDILVPEDKINARLVLIHHPPILKYRIDAVPEINTQKVAVLVNQSPMQLKSQPPFYYHAEQADSLCLEMLGRKPEWIGIAPRVSKILQEAGFSRILDEIWYPPYSGEVPDRAKPPGDLGAKRSLRIGRHARDHWTKWPEDRRTLRDAYCADVRGIDVRLLGGVEAPQLLLGEIPSNWTIYEFDSIPVGEFLSDLDFVVHFVHEDYIEEFGRNVMEAMAASRVVILPSEFIDTFGDAAVYCDAAEVQKTVNILWSDPAAYMKQVEKGLDFVRRFSSQEAVIGRLKRILKDSGQSTAV